MKNKNTFKYPTIIIIFNLIIYVIFLLLGLVAILELIVIEVIEKCNGF